jgi:hypothetical protein
MTLPAAQLHTHDRLDAADGNGHDRSGQNPPDQLDNHVERAM